MWSSDITSVTVTPCKVSAGPKRTLPNTIKQIYSLFFTTSLLEMIVLETNRYAAECMGAEKFNIWQPLTVTELGSIHGIYGSNGAS